MKLMKMISLSLALLALGGLHLRADVDCGEDLGTLRVLTDLGDKGSLGFPPWNFRSNDNADGLTADIACELRKRIGYDKLVFVNALGKSLLVRLQNGEGALAISHISITDANQGLASFIKYNNDTNAMESLVFREAIPGIRGSLIGLCLFDSRVGYVRGQREKAILEKFTCTIGSLIAVGFDTLEEALKALVDVNGHPALGGDIDALLVNMPTANKVTDLDGDLVTVAVEASELGDLAKSEGVGIAVDKSCCQLFVNVGKAIADMVADGTLEKLRNKWGTMGFTPVVLPEPPNCDDEPKVINLNVLSNFILDKYCPCPTDDIEDANND